MLNRFRERSGQNDFQGPTANRGSHPFGVGCGRIKIWRPNPLFVREELAGQSLWSNSWYRGMDSYISGLRGDFTCDLADPLKPDMTIMGIPLWSVSLMGLVVAACGWSGTRRGRTPITLNARSE
jgi:hypothetical protein